MTGRFRGQDNASPAQPPDTWISPSTDRRHGEPKATPRARAHQRPTNSLTRDCFSLFCPIRVGLETPPCLLCPL